jgi:hypothetical protein
MLRQPAVPGPVATGAAKAGAARRAAVPRRGPGGPAHRTPGTARASRTAPPPGATPAPDAARRPSSPAVPFALGDSRLQDRAGLRHADRLPVQRRGVAGLPPVPADRRAEGIVADRLWARPCHDQHPGRRDQSDPGGRRAHVHHALTVTEAA